MAGATFRRELEIATARRETSLIISCPQETDPSIQLFKAYEDTHYNVPASKILTSSLPDSVTLARMDATRPVSLLTDVSKGASVYEDNNSKNIESSTREIHSLLTEWTDTSQNLVRIFLRDAGTDEKAGSLPKEPAQEQQRSVNVVCM